MSLNNIKNFVFKLKHGFKGYPVSICGKPFRLDESLRRFNLSGEETIQETIQAHVSKNGLFVDVGANFGMHTLLASELVGESGRIVAVEPVPANLGLLNRNLSLNGFLDRSKVFPLALTADGVDDVEMTIEPGLSPAASLGKGTFEGDRIKVQSSTLDACLESEKIPDLIKIDVEGAEHEVLKGAVETLKKGPPLLIEVHRFALGNFGSSAEELTEYLSGFGYREQKLSEMESHLGEYHHSLYTVSSN